MKRVACLFAALALWFGALPEARAEGALNCRVRYAILNGFVVEQSVRIALPERARDLAVWLVERKKGAFRELAYPIGGHFHVAHGLSNALVLPHVMRFNVPAAAEMYSEVAPLAMPHLTGGEADPAERLIEGFEGLIDDLGVEKTLRQVGIGHNHLPMLAEEAMKQQRLLVNNPREVAYADALAIYERAL